MVPPDPSRAASCAAASTPRAKPETIVTPACESSRASRAATSRPYRVALREPTTATAGRVNLSSRPTAKRRNGGSAISASRTGYSGSNAVTIRRPQASTDAAHRSAAASSGPARTARALPTEPRRSESSPCGVESRASRPPRSRRAGHNLWGVSSRDRAQEIAVRRAKCIRYIFSPTPDGRRARASSCVLEEGREIRIRPPNEVEISGGANRLSYNSRPPPGDRGCEVEESCAGSRGRSPGGGVLLVRPHRESADPDLLRKRGRAAGSLARGGLPVRESHREGAEQRPGAQQPRGRARGGRRVRQSAFRVQARARARPERHLHPAQLRAVR